MHHDPEPHLGKRDDGTWQHSPPADVPAVARAPSTEPEPEPGAVTVAPSTVRHSVTIDQPGARLTGSSDSEDSDGKPRTGTGEWNLVPAPVIEPGRVIFEKYRLIHKLGEGGMGQVWLVDNLELRTESALKLLNAEIAQHDRAWRRFQREAQLMRKLNHPGAVSVYDFKRSQSIGYIEMEYVRGRTIKEILEEHHEQPMPLVWIVPILDQLCAVLQEAHNHVDEKSGKPKPIIHRDLKPSNLMLVDKKEPGQNLKVLDFGIAKMIGDDEIHDQKVSTIQGEFLGTVSYCSPEQIASGAHGSDGKASPELDGRSDVYSAGVLLYQLLSGVLPFRGNSITILSSHLKEVPRLPSKANPKANIPPEIERLVMQCLEKDPTKRPQTARELAQRFHAAADRTSSGKKSRLRTVVLSAVGVLGLGVVVLLTLPLSDWKPDISSTPPPPRDTPPVPTLPAPTTPKLWEPPGYAAVDPKKLVRGPRLEPERLRRKTDGVEFARYSDGIYLPEGYEPEDPTDRVGDWPRTIVRTRDKDSSQNPDDWVRFIRIKGKTFQLGDVRGNPVPGSEPVWVGVSDFYMLETEVTNRVMEEYLREYPEDKEKLKQWRDAVNLIAQNDPKKVGSYAANGISYLIARKCARFLGGRLPTEAEWEYAAKSERDDYLWPWGSEIPKGGKRLAHLLGPIVNPLPVRKFATDQSEQHVYGLTGNVREWCLDAYKPRPDLIPKNNGPDTPLEDQPWSAAAVDLAGIDPNQPFVLRGGSFLKDLDQAMVFKREEESAVDDDLFDVGFRVVIECPDATQTSKPAD